MLRFNIVVAAATLISASAWADQPVAGAASPGVAVQPAATDKVYPPLPTLAMLPPSSGGDEEPRAPRASMRSKKRLRRPECRCGVPVARLVVSDASRTYLQDVERQLDVALAR